MADNDDVDVSLLLTVKQRLSVSFFPDRSKSSGAPWRCCSFNQGQGGVVYIPHVDGDGRWKFEVKLLESSATEWRLEE